MIEYLILENRRHDYGDLKRVVALLPQAQANGPIRFKKIGLVSGDPIGLWHVAGYHAAFAFSAATASSNSFMISTCQPWSKLSMVLTLFL